MKRALVLGLLLLLVGSLATARTDIFDDIVIEGTVSFTGTTTEFSPSTSFAVYSPAIYLGYDSGARINLAVADTTGVTTVTHTGSGATMGWTVPAWTNTNSTSYTTYTPSWVVGYDAGAAMTFAVSDTTGNVAITHAGSTKAITWTASGGFNLVGDIALGGITQVGNVSMDGATMLFDGSTSVRGVSAGFTSLESPANRFGVSSTIYMQIATTAVTGVTAITHTGSAPTVTWTANSFDFVGPIGVDAITAVGNFSVDGTTAIVDGSTSVRNVSAGFTSSESPANRFGLNATEYMQVATAVTTGITTITHTGSGPTVTWTANSFSFVGDFNADGATMVVDGSTSVRAISAGFASIEGPATRIGPNATTYMNIAVAATTGNTTITHVAGSTDAVSWTAAGGFGFVGPVDVGGFFDMGTMDVGIAVTTASPFAMEVHTEPLTTLTAGDTGLSAGIRSRYQVSVAQPNTISISASESRLRVKHGLAGGVHSAVSGVIEASGTDADFTGTATTQRSAGFFALDFDADVTLANDGWLTGVTINSSVNGAVSMAAVQFAGLRISTNSTCEAWEQGIVIDDNAAVVGLDIGTCTTDIVLQNGETISNATDGELDFSSASLQVNSQPVVLNTRHRVTVAEINAGHEILPAITGRTYRIVDVKAIAYGGAVGTTATVDVLGTQGTASVKLVAYAQASLTRSTVLQMGDAGAAVLADGASFVACDAASAITVGKTGGDADTATGVDFIITYVIE